ncbi:MAG: TetR/AcrR family transcriptional regulator [Cyanobacteria bacterium P01_A01_bin.40]
MNTVTKQLTPKERILKTVDRLFYQQGYLATGINQIIAEAQVAKASFYQHFPSKETLVIAYLRTYNESFFQQLQQLNKQLSEPKAKILALFDLLADFAQQAECRGCAFLNIAAEFSDPDSEPRQLIAQFKTDLKVYIEKLVNQALPSDIDPELAQTKATTVYLLFEAALIESRIHHDLWPIQTSKTAVNQLLH